MGPYYRASGGQPRFDQIQPLLSDHAGAAPGAVKTASTLPALGPSFVTSPHLS